MGLFSKAAIDKKYLIEKKELGSGNFAVVKKATIKPGVKAADIPEGLVDSRKGAAEVAVKIIDKAKVEDMNDIDREIEVMQQLKHANVIKVVASRKQGAKAPRARTQHQERCFLDVAQHPNIFKITDKIMFYLGCS